MGKGRRCTWSVLSLVFYLWDARISFDTESLYGKFAAANFLVPNLSAPLPVKWLKKSGIHELPGGLKVEDFDYLHTLIYVDEVRWCAFALVLLLHSVSAKPILVQELEKANKTYRWQGPALWAHQVP